MGRCKFNPDWLIDSRFSDWLAPASGNDTRNKFFCKSCKEVFIIGKSGLKALLSHMSSLKHTKAHASVASSRSILNYGSKSSTTPNSAQRQGENVDLSSVTTKPVPSSSFQSTLKVSDNDVLKAEIIWTLHVVSSHSSARSSDDMGSLFKAMFPGHPVAEKFKCSRTKLGYLSTFGIAPAIQNELLGLLRNVSNYVIMFDESLNTDLQKKQLDVHVRFVDVDGIVKSRYMDSYFLGRAKASDIVSKLTETVQQIGNDNLLQLSMDGPNVNHKVFKDVSALMTQQNQKSLLNIGTCALHVLHNSIKAGMKASGWEIDSLLRSLYFLFQDVPTRREDFLSLTECKQLPLKFCGHRWLENVPAAQRAIAIWPFVVDYISKAKKGDVTEPICKSFKVLLDCELDKLVVAKMQSFVFLCNILKPFLVKFQRDEPLVPFLTKEIDRIIRMLYGLILKEDYLDGMDTIVSPDRIDAQHFKKHDHIDVGCHAERILSAERKKLSQLQLMNFRMSFQKFVKACIKKILEKSPIHLAFAKSLECFDPVLIASNHVKAKELLRLAANELQISGWITPEEVDQSLLEFAQLREAISLATFSVNDRLDSFYNQHGKLESIPAVSKILRIVLVMSHGNAEVERGFSVNKEVTVENLYEETLIARRRLCQFVQGKNVADVKISKEMLVSCGRSWQRYSEALAMKKREAEMSEERLKRQAKSDEIKELVSKKKKMEIDVDMLIRRADDLNERAEEAGAKIAHDLIVQSNAMRRDAKVKKASIAELSSQITEKEEQLQQL